MASTQIESRNSDVLLDDFLFSFHDEPLEVQLALLTATVKLFIQRPTKGQELVPKVLKWATEETDSVDLRDRGYMYWRLLSTDATLAKQVVMGPKPPITAESEKLDPATLEEMCLNVGTLATVYLKPVQQVFRNARARKLVDSPALRKHTLPTVIAMEAQRALPSVMNGSGSQTANGAGPGRANLSSAVEAADVYFSSLNTSMGSMDIGGDEDFRGSPTAGALGDRHYVVNQSNPQRVYQPQIGGGNGDLHDL